MFAKVRTPRGAYGLPHLFCFVLHLFHPLGHWLLISPIYSGEVALLEGFYVEVENKVVARVECGRHSLTESYLGAVISFVCLFVLVLSERYAHGTHDITHSRFFSRSQQPLQTWRLWFEDAHSYRESLRPFCRKQENLSCSMLKTAPR